MNSKLPSYSIIIIINILLNLNVHNAYSQMVWNQACSFAGETTSYVAVPHSASLNLTGSFTIEAWINPVNSTSPSAQTILQKRLNGSDGYTIYLTSGKVAIRTNSLTRLVGTTVLPNNQWTHIAGSYNSSTDIFRVFINGVQDTTSTVALAEPVTNGDSVLIGNGFNGPFRGLLDEVRIWNVGLTSTDVTQLMRMTLGTNSGFYSALVMSLTFQNSHPAGTLFSLTDWSGNNNNGFNRNVTALNLSNKPSNTISVNECVTLDGTGDYLAGPDHPVVNPVSGITIEFWIYPRSFDANQNVLSTIVHKGNSTGTTTDYRVTVNLNRFNLLVNNTSIFQLSTSGEFFPLNKWTHLAITYSGSDGFIQFLLNGKIRWDDTNFVGNITDNLDSLYIGGTSDLKTFDGYIDEMSITGSALSYSTISDRVFMSVNEANDVTAANVVYNLDGHLVSNTDAGPRLFFKGNAKFSHNAFVDNRPVSPLTNSTGLNFTKGFYLSNPNIRIPASGTSGFMNSDTLDVPINESITDINVFVALNHTDEDNLILSLISPAGSSVNLYNTNSLINNSDNAITLFDDQADSSLLNNRFVMFTPRIKPLNSLNSVFSGANTSGKWKLRIQDVSASDTGILIGWGIQFNNHIKRRSVLSLRSIVQGFYDPLTNLMTRDTVRVYIRNHKAPYDIIDSAKALVDSTGRANYTFFNVPDGVPVYIQFNHRNSIETWSRNPVSSTFSVLFANSFSPFTSTLQYDLSSSQSSAFGNNLARVDFTPNTFAIYSGDVNQDGIIDASDLSEVDNDAFNSTSGYVRTDVNGDNFVDASDLSIVDNNAFTGIMLERP